MPPMDVSRFAKKRKIQDNLNMSGIDQMSEAFHQDPSQMHNSVFEEQFEEVIGQKNDNFSRQ